MYRYNRMLRIGDGADEVHKQVIARMELAKVADPSRRRWPVMAVTSYETLLVERPARRGGAGDPQPAATHATRSRFRCSTRCTTLCGELLKDDDARAW